MITKTSLINQYNNLWYSATVKGIRRYPTYRYPKDVGDDDKKKNCFGQKQLRSKILMLWIFASVTLMKKRTLISLKGGYTFPR